MILMPKRSPSAYRDFWPLACRAGLQIIIFVPMISLLIGCSGGEDFSKPPEQIQNQLTKTAQDPAARPGDGTETAMAENATAPSQIGAATEGVAESATTPAPDAVATNGGSPALTATPAESPAPATMPAPVNTNPVEAAPGDGAAVMTASGKSADAIAAKKEANSANSVVGNAGGLLGSLKSSGAKKAAAAANPSSDPDAAQMTTRFGRMALSRIQWLQLVSQLTRQFFVAATPNGNSLAGSTGERSLEALDTQLDVRSQTLTATGNRQLQATVNPIHIPVTGLPGIINSLELTNDGQQVLIGTTDGRLLVRSAASTSDWDLFARDLFLFQDEHRRTARLSDKAIVAIRCLPDSRLLTIDANGVCAFWKLNEAVLPVTPILEMTVEQAKAAEAETVTATPISSFPVSGFEILSITIAEEFQLGAVVTSSEEIYVFRTTTGELIETLKADLLADTQPVCVDFIADGTEILAGLADGRILRRALTGADAVSGLNDQGETVDYDPVFIPDVQDQVSSITSIRSIPHSRTIYFGTIDGNVVRFDAAQKRIEQIRKRHAAPVIELCVTPHGMLSIGGDRQAQLFDVPVTPHSTGQDSDVTFQLPRDETLEETVADDSQPENAATAATSKSTRPTRTRIAEKPVEVDLSLAGIRPADTTLALYGHQLRSATEPAMQMEFRKQILRHRGANSLADSLGKDPVEVPDGPPLRAGEVMTQMQFSPDNWSRVLLAISDDGLTTAAVHRASADQAVSQTGQLLVAGALSLFDMATGTALRSWPQPSAARSRQLILTNQMLIGNPAMTRYWNSSGFAETDPQHPVSSTIVSPDLEHLFLGRATALGVAGPALTRFTPSDRTETPGFKLFEFMITAMAWSGTGDRLYIGTRERDQVRVFEVDPKSLSIEHEVARHPFNGRIPEDSKGHSPLAKSGTILIQPSPSDKLLLTWGFYDGGEKLLLWRRGSSGWPLENVSVITIPDSSPDIEAIDHPVAFINQQDGRLAIVTEKGLLILSTKKIEVEHVIPIPIVTGHRPPCVISQDSKWLLTGDGDGTIWAMSLISLNSKPLTFSAHTGPIAGLAMSPNGRFLATVGEDNFLRSWRVDGFLKR